MGLYASGEAGKSAGIAAIKAAVNARITTQADGTLVLNTASLSEWLALEANKVVTEDNAANLAAAQEALARIDARGDVAQLGRIIDKQNWITRPDWPNITSVTTGQSFITAAMAMIADMNRAAEQIESKYRELEAQIPATLSDVYLAQDIEAGLPDIVTRLVDSRFYVYTYVTDWGEESAPSLVSSLIEADQNDTVGVTRVASVPAGRNIVGWRLYRSNVGSQTAAFQLVTDVAWADAQLAEGGGFDYFKIAATAYTDAKKSSELGEVCPSITWAEPPANLTGLIGMGNGVLAGYFGNTVCFCEPYYPYAWPVEYQITTEYPVVALGTFGQTLVVAHTAGIDYISGSDSASMSRQPNVSLQSCASPRSMVSVEGGVAFAAPDGLCLADGSGVKLVSEAHFVREDWQKLDPTSMVAAYHEASYFFLHGGASPGCYAIHIPTAKLTTVDITGSAFHVDRRTDRMYAATGTNIRACFASASYRTGVWRSKVAVMPMQTALAWLTVESDFATAITVRWYGDGVLRHTATVTSRTPVRVPPGRWLEHEIEVESAARWNRLTMASSGEELRKS